MHFRMKEFAFLNDFTLFNYGNDQRLFITRPLQGLQHTRAKSLTERRTILPC